MTNEEKKECEKVYKKPFSEIEETEIPAILRKKEKEKEELADGHIAGEIFENQRDERDTDELLDMLYMKKIKK